MASNRYVIAYGDDFTRSVQLAPPSYGDNLLTREQAARKIVQEADAMMEMVRFTRRKAMRILRAEEKKAATAS